jgi:tetraacyldisaccharide 4'-kinase
MEMKKLLRKYLLLPFSLLYAIITELRNRLYDTGIFHSNSFAIPIISVGNLNVGGSGKTPQIEYLIRLLQNRYKIAVLSRGYKRKTKSFIVANPNSTPEEIGDEPYQIAQKFPDIIMAVSKKRAPAIKKLIKKYHPDIILLDDAFQHRQVNPGLNIVLTPYHNLFIDDLILPSGNLRECKHHIKRADILLVTKIPEKIDKNNVLIRIRKYFNKDVFFSKIDYANTILGNKKSISWDKLKDFKILVITGIANPEPLYQHLSKKYINFDRLKFNDHHSYTKEDAKKITSWFNNQPGNNKIILTTEKDYVKLSKLLDVPLFYIPIQTKIENEELFNKKIIDYVDSRKLI